jgi:hypothetical protein
MSGDLEVSMADASRLSFLIALGALATGCSTPAPATQLDPMRIEVLGFADCPSTGPFRERVQAAADRVGGFTVVAIDQTTLPAEDLRRGYPAPTALVGGRDLFGLPVPAAPSMGCRMYAGGLPGVEVIAVKLRALKDP